MEAKIAQKSADPWSAVLEPFGGFILSPPCLPGASAGRSGKNIVKEIIQYFEEDKHRIKVPEQCGYLEVVTVKPFGVLVAKFDTGNGTKASMFVVDKMEDEGVV